MKRDFTRLSQQADKVLSGIGKQLLACQTKLFEHWHRFKQGHITRDELLRHTAPIVRSVGEWLEQGSYTDPTLRAARFCKNLLKHFSALWTFLENDDLEPTNNHAERCLRHLVIWRKKYFSTQSEYGSEYVARTASLIMTAKLQKTNAFHYLAQAIQHQFDGIKIPAIVQ